MKVDQVLTIKQVQTAVDNGWNVQTRGGAYCIVKDRFGYLIKCNLNGRYIGFTNRKGDTPNIELDTLEIVP